MSDEAELAATELAANVIKHVGEGVSATLVLEVGGDGLRLEMHDKSHELPRIGAGNCWDLDGRGLQLLASLAQDWGVLLTATGKAVWCEIALKPVRHCARVRRAAALLDEYRRTGGGPTVLADSEVVLEETVTDVISDLLHWLTVQGGDPDDILDRALMRYEAEADAA